LKGDQPKFISAKFGWELWTFAYFDRLCKLEKRGMKLKKILLWNCCANLNHTNLKADHPRFISAKFGWDWHSSFRGEDLNVIFYQNMPNLHNRYKSTERKTRNIYLNQTLLKWFLGGPLPKLCPVFENSDQDGHHSRT
jgi:hypothetical protein